MTSQKWLCGVFLPVMQYDMASADITTKITLGMYEVEIN